MKYIILLLFSSIASGQVTSAITAFNAGELSPHMLMRVGFQKYDNAAQELENMLILSQGPVERRPGTRYIAETKTSSSKSRLIPFEFSKTDAYIIEFGDEYLRFYRNGGQILTDGGSTYDISTDYDEGELFDIQYVQLADVMYLVDGNDPPQKLTRTDHNAWTIEDVNFVTGPFLDENKTTTTITPTGTTDTITLNSSTDIFESTHVGALWRINHRTPAASVSGSFDANGSSSVLPVGGDFIIKTDGTWTGTVTLQRDPGDGYEDTEFQLHSEDDGNIDDVGNEDEIGVNYKVTMTSFSSGSCTYNFSAKTYTHVGIVKITAFTDGNTVTATVLTDLGSTDASDEWSEGYWSDFRSWPQTIEFHEQRLVFGGSESYPQTLWSSKTANGALDDYEDMTEGTNADAALIYVLPGQNPIQWLLSQTYLMIGTLSSVGRWGSADDATPITPTEPTNYRVQAQNGSAYIQAVFAGDAVLYVERGGQRVREFAYSLERDRFVTPDLTILAEHITGDGIIDIAYQLRPDSILWCVTEGGVLATLTYERTEDVVGWSRQTTEGSYESVAVIPGSDEDEVWVIVNRTIDGSTARYVEQFQPRAWLDQKDAFFVDSGLSFDGGAAVNISNITLADPAVVTVSTWPTDGAGDNLSDGDEVKILSVVGTTELNGNIYTIDDANVTDKTFSLEDSTGTIDINSVDFTAYVSGGTVQRFEKDFSNLSHIEAETVAILGDGNALPTEIVSSGVVGLDTWSNVVHIGIPYKSQMMTMPVVLQTQLGLSAGKTARIGNVLVNFYRSLGVKYGLSEDSVDDVIFYDSTDDVGDPILVVSGWKSLSFLAGHYREAVVYLETDQPLPFECRAIDPQLTITER